MGRGRMAEVRWPRWTKRQAKFAPFGVRITTYLLTYIDKSEWVIWQVWKIFDDLGAVSNMVALGVAAYIIIMVVIEWSRKMALGAFTKGKQRRIVRRIDSAISMFDDPDKSHEDIREAMIAAKKEAVRPPKDNFVIRWLASWDDEE